MKSVIKTIVGIVYIAAAIIVVGIMFGGSWEPLACIPLISLLQWAFS